MLGVLCALTGAWGQVGNQPAFVTSDVPSISHAMIKLRMELPTLMTFGTTSLTYMYQPAGRFQIQTSSLAPYGGNPTRTGDENRLLASVANQYSNDDWGYEYSSKVTVAVDADPADETVGLFWDPHYLAADLGTEADRSDLINFWPLVPTVGVRDISGEFQVPAVEDVDTTTDQWIRVRQVLTVVGDVVQFEYIVTNEDTTRHTVGLRVLIDATFGGGSSLDGQAIILPDGSTFDTERTIPDASVADDTLPDRWVAYDDPSSPNVAVRGVLNTSEVTDPGIADSSAGMPDAVSWGQMRDIGADLQYYPSTNSRASILGEDWAYAVYWKPEQLNAGESRRYVTYFGLGSSAGDYEPPYALMAYAPFQLVQRKGDDPATADTVESYYLADENGNSPFKVSMFMDNFGTSTMYDATGRVRMPTGLSLASGQTTTKTAGDIRRNEIDSLSWDVLATDARPGRSQIRFTGPQGKVLTRTISIPAVPVLNPWPNSANGLEMVSVPYEFDNNDAEWVFGSLGSLVPGGSAALIRYDPTITDYRWFPDAAVTSITPGKGYWLLNRNRETITLPDDAKATDITQTYAVELKTGWNQIGNPFGTSLCMADVRISAPDGGDWTLDEAVSRKMLLPTVYAYDTAAGEYTWQLTSEESFLDPYMGYWILARQDLTMMFPPPTTYTPAQVRTKAVASSRGSGPSNWKVDLHVAAPGMGATTQSIAARTSATRGLDEYDVPQPPAGLKDEATYLRSAFYPGESGLGMPYLVDTRDAGQTSQQWNLVVKTNAINTPITVTWPSLQSLPSNLVATLVDDVASQRRYMRTTTSYTFRTGEAVTERVLKVLVQPRSDVMLNVSGVYAAQTAQGVMLSYTLSADAAVDVRVRNIAGRVVSEVASGQVAAAGQNTVLWNGRSTHGTLVPTGRYLCEITARSPLTGQSLSVVQPLTLKR